MADGSSPSKVIRPQPGPQEQFLSSPADIAIYGGAAGGGKTFALLMEAMRHVRNPEFGGVIFRRESVQITNEGGLWDTALTLYPSMGASWRAQPKMQFNFPSGARIGFGHLNAETSVLDWQGAQLAFIGYDELTHFTRKQFFYMLSRNRSTSGVRPYIRATCNPDAESWVAEFIAWWIDQETGLPIRERAGKVRWFVRRDDVLHWADSAQALVKAHRCQPEDCKSVTFIPALVTDNPALLRSDPGYLANLQSLSLVDRQRLLHGNWKIKPAAGLYFKRSDVTVIDEMPDDVGPDEWVRAWDLAATEPSEVNPDPDYTAGVLMARRRSGKIVIGHVHRVRKRAEGVRSLIKATAHDEAQSRVVLPVDPGQAGKEQSDSYVAELSGFRVMTIKATTNKIARAEPFAAQWQRGRVEIVRGPWNEAFLAELEGFPEASHDDQVDAASDAFTMLPALATPAVAGSLTSDPY